MSRALETRMLSIHQGTTPDGVRLRTERQAPRRGRGACRVRGRGRAGAPVWGQRPGSASIAAARRSQGLRRGGCTSTSTDSSTSATGARRPRRASIRLASDAVPRRQEAVLGEQLRQVVAGSAPEPSVASMCTSDCTSATSASGVFDRDLGVHDAHLDGSPARLQAHVPPQERRLGKGAAAQQQVDALDVVLVVREGAGEPDAGKRPEHRRSRRGQPGLAPLPEGGVRRQRQQQRQMRAQPVHRAHRVLGVRHGDVDVQGERRLTARELAQRRVQQL